MAALTRRWVHDHLITAIYLVAIVAAFAFLAYGQEKQRRTSEAACVRGNLIRAQVDHNSGVIRGHLVEAAAARDLLATLHESEGDVIAARIERASAAAFRRLLVGFHPLGPAPCHRIYDRFHL